jgi:hypothetical protein
MLAPVEVQTVARRCGKLDHQSVKSKSIEDFAMQPFRVLAIIVISCCSVLSAAFAQQPPQRMLILPVSANGIDPVYVETAESILRTEISKFSTMDIISQPRTLDALGDGHCTDHECARDLGRELGASRVLGCRLSALGDKIIAQYFMSDVESGRDVLIDQATALSVEDLETLMKRIASSVVNGVPVSKNAEIGTILAVETQEPRRRASRNNFGIAFGYLYPQDGYDDRERKFLMDARFDHEMDRVGVGLLVGFRNGIATNLYGHYLLTKQDLCPYVGGSLGFHWINHNPTYTFSDPSAKKRGDGFELGVGAGLRLFHTYDFQMIFNIEYVATFNDYDDRAIVFTIGIL